MDAFGARAPEGERPGALGARLGTVVVDLVSYDPATNIARIPALLRGQAMPASERTQP